jgi:organic radical activating enzyme
VRSLRTHIFKEKDYLIHLETNGTITISHTGLFWITVSPKVNWIQRIGHELKVVYQCQDLSEYNGDFKHYFLQPCSMGNIHETISKIKELTAKIQRLQAAVLLQRSSKRSSSSSAHGVI